MSPPIRDGSGDSIGSIRLGDGSEISEVRTGAGDVLFSAIPDSGVYLYVQQRKKGIRVWETSNEGFFQSSDEKYLTSYGGAQNGSAITLNNGGTKVYYSDGDTLFQESLSTPFDLRTNGGVESTLDTNIATGNEPYGFGITWFNNGSKAYVSTGEITSDGEQRLYTFSTPYNLDTASYQRSDFVPSGSRGSSAVDFNKDGTKGYNGSRGQSTIYQYDLTTPFDLSTRTNTESIDIIKDPIALRFEPFGHYLYTGHHSPDEVNRYECSTPFDLTTVGSETTIESANGDAFNGVFVSGPRYYL